MLPLTICQIAHILGEAHDNQALIFSACVDSRKKGDLFFALPGSKHDGHTFLEAAAQQGAQAAVVLKSYSGPSFGLVLIHVEDVLHALKQLAKEALKRHRPKIVAVTGSLGKTTTKDFLTTLLKSRFTVFSDAGNANSQIGLPLALLRLQEEEVAVLEMGMSEPGDLRALIDIAAPDVALITTVALVHAAFFSSLREIARTKAEIFSHEATRIGLYNGDMPHPEEALESGRSHKMAFSVTDPTAPFFAQLVDEQIEVYEEGHLVLQHPWTLLGKHNVLNFLAAAAAGRMLGLSWNDIKLAMDHLKLPHKRLQLVSKGSKLFINDSYNASRHSICSALDTLSVISQGRRRVAVLSEMLELGSFAEEEHKAVGRYALDTVDYLYCIGPGSFFIKELFDNASKPCFYCEDKEVLKAALQEELREGDVVLVKGGHRYNLGDLLEHF